MMHHFSSLQNSGLRHILLVYILWDLMCYGNLTDDEHRYNDGTRTRSRCAVANADAAAEAATDILA